MAFNKLDVVKFAAPLRSYYKSLRDKPFAKRDAAAVTLSDIGWHLNKLDPSFNIIQYLYEVFDKKD